MNTQYHYRKQKRYGIQRRYEDYEETLSLPEAFEFTEIQGYNPWYKNYICIIPEASRWKKRLTEDENIRILDLPLDYAILILTDIQFGVIKPPLISFQEANQKLKTIREEVVWEEVTYGIKFLYKLAWIDETGATMLEYDLTTGRQDIIEKRDLGNLRDFYEGF